MPRTLRNISLAAFAAALVPASGQAQEVTPEVQSWIQEFQQTHARLAAVEERALEDATLAAEQDRVTTAVRNAMFEVDPTIPQQIERLQEIQTDAQTAAAAGDQTRLETLALEADGIERHFGEVQALVMAQPEVATQIAAFRAQLRTRMNQIEPETDRMIARLEELEERLVAFANNNRDGG